MRFARAYVAVFLSLVVVTPAVPQQTGSPSVSASTILSQSLAAQLGNTQISDVTLIGTARRIAGSDDESGTITLKLLSTGATRLDFNFPSGPRSEFRSISNSTGHSGGWSGPDGVVHAMAGHNLVNDWGWFPLFSLAGTNAPGFVVSMVGTETRNGQSVVHLSVSQQAPSLAADAAQLFTHLSQMEIFLDATTLLPAAIAYNIHPDNNALLDIPVELRFSDFRSTNGTQIPFHIQKFINNSLALDFQFQSVALNTGLSAAQIGGAQ